MTDPTPTHTKDPRHSGGSRHNSETDKQGPAPSPTTKTANATPTRTSSAHTSSRHNSETDKQSPAPSPTTKSANTTPTRTSSAHTASRHNSETDKQSPAPSPTTKSANVTPTRPSSAFISRQTNSTPRLRSRPAPVVRSLSTPLTRSLSMRVSKKEKRWSMRLEDPNNPATTTYRDDYRTPDALSLSSLNLETSTDSIVDPRSPTTYRDSFRWKGRALGQRGDSRPHDDKALTTKTPATLGSIFETSSADHSSPGSGKVSGNGESSQPPTQTLSSSRSSIPSPKTETQSSFLRRNDSSRVTYCGNGDSSHVSVSRKSSGSSNEDSVSFKPANGLSKPDKASASLVDTVSGRGLQSLGTPPSRSLTNGVAGHNGAGSDVSTPRRARGYQLQSSNGGSPFVYGSDSGSWV